MKKNNITGKKVLITGSTGFIGNVLSKKISDLGGIVYGISKKVKNSKFNLQGDILEYEKIFSFVKKNKIDICFHLAAESLVESGQDNPHRTFRVNTEGTLNILEAARINNLERIIIASTAHVYGKNKVPYYEGYMPRPTRPYETSKACTDLIAQSYAETYNLPVLIPRFVNIYGPGDTNFTRLIPKTIRNVLNGISPTMWGGGIVRDYLYIDDAIDAFLKLANTEIKIVEKNKIFNFGTSNTISVKELIEKIIFHSGKKMEIKKIETDREGDVREQYLSVKKAKRVLSWNPSIDIDTGLKKTIAWYSKLNYNRE